MPPPAKAVIHVSCSPNLSYMPRQRYHPFCTCRRYYWSLPLLAKICHPCRPPKVSLSTQNKSIIAAPKWRYPDEDTSHSSPMPSSEKIFSIPPSEALLYAVPRWRYYLSNPLTKVLLMPPSDKGNIHPIIHPINQRRYYPTFIIPACSRYHPYHPPTKTLNIYARQRYHQCRSPKKYSPFPPTKSIICTIPKQNSHHFRPWQRYYPCCPPTKHSSLQSFVETFIIPTCPKYHPCLPPTKLP